MESKLYGSADTAGPPGGSAPTSMRGMEGAAMAPGGMASAADPTANALTGPTPGGGAPPPMPSVDELKDAMRKTAFLNAKFRELLSAPKMPTRKQVMDLSTELLQRGILSAPRLASELATLPEPPELIAKWLEAHFKTTSAQIDQLSMLLEGADDPMHPLNPAAAGAKPGMANGALAQ